MIEKLGVFAILLSGGLVYAGEYFGMPRLASAAIMLFGAWVAAWGVEIAIKGEVRLIHRQSRRYEFFSGIPARLWAAIFISIGVLILLFGFLDLTTRGGTVSFLERLTNSPAGWGTLLGVVGLFVTASGVIRLLAGSASASGKVDRLQEFGFRLGGAWHVLLGIVLLSLATGLIFAPNLMNAMFDALVDALKNWFLSR
jgi:hypothetical protein